MAARVVMMWNMNLVLLFDPTRLRRWHVQLAERIAQRPNTRLSIEWRAGAAPTPFATAMLLAVERLICRLPDDDITGAASVQDFAEFQPAPEQPDLVLDFTASKPRPETRTWRLTFDGIADETA